MQDHDRSHRQEKNGEVEKHPKRLGDYNKEVELFKTTSTLDWVPQEVDWMAAENIGEDGTQEVDRVEEIDEYGGIFDRLDGEDMAIQTG